MIRNELAYDRAVRRNIRDNTFKTWSATQPRLDEILSALNMGRCSDTGGYTENFIGSMAQSFDTYGKLSEKQVSAILKGIDSRAARQAEWDAKKAQEAAQKAFVGVEGEKMTCTLTVKKTIALEGVYGVTLLSICEDDKGNTIIYKGNSNNFPREGESALVTFTVKMHNLRDGVKQTIIQRPKIVQQ